MTIPLRCVVDASVNIKQFIPDPLSERVKQLFAHLANPQTDFSVPDLFYIESANTLWKYVRAGLYAATDVPDDLAALKALPLGRVPTAELMEEAGQTHLIAVTHTKMAFAELEISERGS